MKKCFNIQIMLAAILFLSPHIASADEDIKFIYSLCKQIMMPQTSMPASEINKFCSCASNEVRKNITQKQRNSIRKAKKILRSNKPFPRDLFQKTKLNTLVAKSQEYCTDLLYPVEPRISDEEHKKYSSLANKSVDEFNSFIDIKCDKYPKSKERSQCLVLASSKWLESEGYKYKDIPSPYYITGNDLAETFISGGVK